MINLDDFENKLESPDKSGTVRAGALESTKTHPTATPSGSLPNAEIAVRCLDYLASGHADDYQDGGWLEVGWWRRAGS